MASATAATVVKQQQHETCEYEISDLPSSTNSSQSSSAYDGLKEFHKEEKRRDLLMDHQRRRGETPPSKGGNATNSNEIYLKDDQLSPQLSSSGAAVAVVLEERSSSTSSEGCSSIRGATMTPDTSMNALAATVTCDNSSSDAISICSTSPPGSTDFLPVDNGNGVPQWKKDLLQRRKTNVARTIGANQSTICSKKDSTTLASSPLSTSPVAPLPRASSDVEDRTLEDTNDDGVCSKSLSMDNIGDGNNKCSNSSTSNNTKICASHFVNVKTPAVIQQNTSVSSALPSSASSCTSSSSGHYTPSLSNSPKPEGISVQQQQNVVTSSKSTITTHTSQQQEQQQYHSSKVHNISQSTSAIGYSKTKSTSGGPEEEIKCINNNSNSNSDNNNTSGTCLTTLQEQQQQQQQQQQPDYNELQQQPFQLHSRLDANKSGASCRGALIGISTSVTTKSINSTTTSFIKNPAASKYSKVNKYKLSAKSSNSPGTVATNPTVISTPSKKMVAVQEVNENSPNTAGPGNLDFDFDPSEELQYGPGIVSKLRCRYLSLALRQSNGKQRPPLDNLRRATSLNNLLDNDATDDDCNSTNSGVNNCINNRDHKIISNKIHSGQQRPVFNQSNQQIEHNNYQNTTTPDEFVATFQKNIKLFEKDKQSVRSRQIKRGNDSLKRARSVEALLVSSSPISSIATSPGWNKESCNTLNGGGIPISKNNLRLTEINQNEFSSMTSSCDVTIEDKIMNGRERISIEKTPKRLTSIIDDAEKPPPDLVKQTLKIFEATANRRGRGLSRNNGTGEVAAKVANYKSIISQEKPPIIYPKPPLSPKKIYRNKPTSLDLGKRMPSTAVSASTNAAIPLKKSTSSTSPISNLTKKFSGCDLINNKTSNANSNDGESSVISSPATVDNSEKHSSFSPQSSSPLEDAMTAVTLGHRASSGINIHETATSIECATATSIQNSFGTNNYNDDIGSDNIPVGNKNQNQPLRRTPPNIIPRKHYENSFTNSSLTDSPILTISQQKVSLKKIEGLTSDGGRLLSSPLPSTAPQSSTSLLHGIISTSTPIQNNILRQRNISESEESTDSVDDHHHDEAFHEQQVIKRVPKLALENISKAGSTQHFSFNKETATATRSTTAVTGSLNKVSSLTSPSSASATTASLATSSSFVNGNVSNSVSGTDSQQSLGATNTMTVSSGGGGGGVITSPNTTKQIGVIRPLVTTDMKIHHQQQQFLYKEQQHKVNDDNKSKSDNDLLDCSIAVIEECTNVSLGSKTNNSRISRDNLAISNLSQSNSTLNVNNISNSQTATTTIINNNNNHNNSNINASNNNNIRRTSPLPPSSVATAAAAAVTGINETNRPMLTSREIEKNFINEKKTEAANLESSISNQSANDSHGEFPIKWQLGKKKPWHSANSAQSQNNCMVFNFKDRKEVPDYIENDGLLFKRRRELPKPNEAGFVLLDNLTLETSTDPDDSWKSMGPPSPCDVEFENANIIIDGKSSIRHKSRGEASLRVQFDDTLTSTFEYPSESSLLEDLPKNDFQLSSNNKDVQDSGKVNSSPSAVAASLSKNVNTNTSESSSNVSNAAATCGKEYIPTVEEIIQLPTGPKLLGNMSLGSAPLANYTPVKAQINTNFELGVTRPIIETSASSSTTAGEKKLNSENMNGNSLSTTARTGGVGNEEYTKRTASSMRNDHLDIRNSNNDGVDDDIFRSNGDENTADNDSLPYLKPASDDLTIAYSEGTKKTDLLY